MSTGEIRVVERERHSFGSATSVGRAYLKNRSVHRGTLTERPDLRT